MARYLIELPLIEYRMLKYTPSLLAASALFLSLKIIPKYDEQDPTIKLPAWIEKMLKHTGYTES